MENFFDISILKNYPYRIIWNTTYRCDFACSYCYFSDKDKKHDEEIVSKLSATRIAQAFESTGKEWLILLSGGEPFMIPDFLDLAKLLSAKNHLQITSNLFSEKVYRLHEYVHPEKVLVISASLHPEERKKHDPRYNDFTEKYFFLKNQGFRMLVNIVTYPPQIRKIPSEINYLKDRGIDNITVLTYRGCWNNRYYPGRYSKEELKVIEKYCIDRNELLIAGNKMNFKGKGCEAGMNYFSMDPSGNVSRCGSISENHGNLFYTGIQFDNIPKLCTASDCVDCYLGLVSLQNKF